MAETENIKDGKYFDDYARFQIIPVRISRTKKLGNTFLVGIAKQVCKIFVGIVAEQAVFEDTVGMKTPCIHHLCKISIIQPDPTVKNTRHYL